MTGPATTRVHRLRATLRPRNWGISARSAVVSATVVVVALLISGAVLVVVLYYSLINGVDGAASARVDDIAANLQSEPAEDLDAALLATDQRVVAIQVIDQRGAVVERSADASTTPIVSVTNFGPSLRVLRDDAAPDDDMRIAGQVVTTPAGQFTILVGGGSEAVESTVFTVMALWGIAAPVVVAVSGIVNFVLVRRSLRSVDAIRSQVAAISTSDLSERVPVPPRRDEISALAVTMNEMLARIEAGHAAQRRFVGDASHELRSPLATIVSALDVVHAHPELLSEQLTTDTLRPEAQRMQALVEDLLLLARADERGLPLRTELVDLDDLGRAEAARIKQTSSLTVISDIKPVQISADAARIARVMRNLLDNATRHARSTIEIVIDRDDLGDAVITVGDDGEGIPEADRVRVFDRFVRLDEARTRTGGGAGLGLAIVAEIVHAHGGSVVIADRSGGGTCFVVTLPQ